MILTISGSPGTGKTTLMKGILGLRKDAKLLPNVTTRTRRPSDLPGDYLYVTEPRFQEMLERGELLGVFPTHGSKYAIYKPAFDEALKSGGNFLVGRRFLDLQVLHDYAPGKLLSVFLCAPEESTLRCRLQSRGDDPEKIEVRIRDSRTWEKIARCSILRLHIIPATTPRKTLEAVLELLE